MINRNLSRLALHGALSIVPAVFGAMLLPTNVAFGQSAAKSVAVSKAIIERIQDRWNLHSPTSEVTLRRYPFLARDFDKPGAFDSIGITPLTRKHPRGVFPMLVDLYLGGISIRHGQVAAQISVFDSVLVSEGRSTRGALAADLALQIKFVETTNLPDAHFKNIAELDGLRLARNLQHGDILLKSALEQIPDVEFGQEVRIEYIGGGLLLTATGFALKKGITGETVRVRNLSSKRIIKAVIAGPGLVQIRTGTSHGRTK